jgi:hypothetical protein
MPRYLVERSFPHGWDVHDDGCRQIIERNGDEITWLHSYVSEDCKRAFCVYEAPSPEAIRKGASRNQLPIDSITSVRVLNPHPYPRYEERCAN